MLILAGIATIAVLPWLLELSLFRKHILLNCWWLLIPLSIPIGIGASKIAASELLLLFWLTLPLWQNLGSKAGFGLKHPVSILLLLEIGIYVMASANSSMPLISAKRLVLHSLYIFGAYFIMIAVFRQGLSILKMIYMLSMGLLPVFLVILNFLSSYHFNSEVAAEAPRPFFTDHTEFGAFAAFLLPPLFVSWKHAAKINIRLRLWQKLLLPVLLLCVVFSFSRAVWLSVVGAGVLYALILLGMNFRHMLLMLLAVALIIFSYSREIYEVVLQNEAISNRQEVVEQLKSMGNVKTDVSNLERINRWKSAWKMFEERPLLGFGPGTYQFQYAPYQELRDKTTISSNFGDAGNAHSEYLMYLSETGIIGFLIFAAICFWLLHTGFRLFHYAQEEATRFLALGLLLGLAGFLVHSVFNSFLETDKIGLVFYLFAAALVSLDLKDRSYKREY